MTAATPTPGPWAYEKECELWRIVKPAGIQAMAGSSIPAFQRLTTFPIYIGDIYACPYNVYNGEGRDQLERGEANAAHICLCVNTHADLMEALEGMLALYQGEDKQLQPGAYASAARAALKLARGMP